MFWVADYCSMNEASRQTGINFSSIFVDCRNESNKSGYRSKVGHKRHYGAWDIRLVRRLLEKPDNIYPDGNSISAYAVFAIP